MHSGFLLNGPWTGGRVTNLIRIHPRLIGQRTKRIRMCACVGLSGGLRGDDDASSRYTGAALERKPRSRVPSYHTYFYYLFFLFQNAYAACYRIIASGLRYRFITYYFSYAYKSDKFIIVITTIQQCSSVLYDQKKKTNKLCRKFVNLASAAYAFWPGEEGSKSSSLQSIVWSLGGADDTDLIAIFVVRICPLTMIH